MCDLSVVKIRLGKVPHIENFCIRSVLGHVRLEVFYFSSFLHFNDVIATGSHINLTDLAWPLLYVEYKKEQTKMYFSGDISANGKNAASE